MDSCLSVAISKLNNLSHAPELYMYDFLMELLGANKKICWDLPKMNSCLIVTIKKLNNPSRAPELQMCGVAVGILMNM